MSSRSETHAQQANRRGHPGSDLLPHRDALRRLVRGLVRDESDVDDVVQEAYLEALEKPPHSGWNVKSWLLGAARHLALRRRRTDARRTARERAAAQPESSDAVGVRARLEATREVMDAVLELDPGSQQVLLLRYFHDLPPRRIASELGLPKETVKTRLKRALGKLRARLDARHGGHRKRWLAVLLPLAFPAPGLAAAATATATSAGAAIMKHKIAAGLLVGAGAVAAVIATYGPSTPDARRDDPGRGAVHADASSEDSRTPDDRRRSIVSSPFEGKDGAPTEDAPPPMRLTPWLTGRVARHDGRVVEGAVVIITGDRGTINARTDREGRYRVGDRDIPVLKSIAIRIDGHLIGFHEDLPVLGKEPATFDITLEEPCLVHGRVVDTEGKPVPRIGALLSADDGARTLESKISSSGPTGNFFLDVPFSGAATLRLMPRLRPSARALNPQQTRGVTLVWRENRRFPRPRETANELWPQRGATPVHLVPATRLDAGTFRLGRQGTVAFQLVDAVSGAPVADTMIGVRCPIRNEIVSTAPTDHSGRSTLPWLSGRQRMSLEIGEVTRVVSARVPVGGTVHVRVAVGDEANEEVVDPAVITVQDPDGRPIPRARVRLGAQERLTGRDGRTTLVPTGEPSELTVQARGYDPYRNPAWTLSPDGAAFTLVVSAQATLRVSDARGAPVDEIEIGFLGKPSVVFAGFERSRGIHGDHAIEPMPRGARFSTLLLRSTHGVARIDLPAGIAAGEVREVTLEEASWVTGRLVTPTSEPVSGARVATGSTLFPLGLREEFFWPGDRFGQSSIGAAITADDGSFRVLAPVRNGILVALTAGGGGALVRYSHAKETERVVVQAPVRLDLTRSAPASVDQSATLVLTDSAVQFWVRARWARGTRSLSVTLPFEGRWSVAVPEAVDMNGRWAGRHLEGRVDVRGRKARLDL